MTEIQTVLDGHKFELMMSKISLIFGRKMAVNFLYLLITLFSPPQSYYSEFSIQQKLLGLLVNILYMSCKNWWINYKANNLPTLT